MKDILCASTAQTQREDEQHLTNAVSWDCGCLKLMISKARVFFTLARSASLAACSKEWPLNSSVNEIMVDIRF